MNSGWAKVGRALKAVAPLVGTALAGPAGAAIGTLLANRLGVDDNPDIVARAIEADPDAAERIAVSIQEINHAEVMAAYAQAGTSIAEINQTIRAEVMSTGGLYKTGWRPLVGWGFAASLVTQMLGTTLMAGYSVLNHDPAMLAATINGLTQLTTATAPIWAMATTALGVNIYQRSKDKHVAATGQPPSAGLLGAIVSRIARQ